MCRTGRSIASGSLTADAPLPLPLSAAEGGDQCICELNSGIIRTILQQPLLLGKVVGPRQQLPEPETLPFETTLL